MNKIKIFLSLPMSGRTDEEIRAQIKRMKEGLLKSALCEGKKVIFEHNLNCKFADGTLDAAETPNLLYLGEAIKKMAFCDYIALGAGWDKARGCLVEAMVAANYNITRIHAENF